MRGNELSPTTSVVDEGPAVSQQGFRLVVLSGELRGREVEVLKDSITLGRSRQCDVTFPDISVSRVHVEIRRDGQRYRLLDRASSSGTLLGGSHVTDAFLRPGDELRLGQVEIRFVALDRQPELLPSERERFGPVLGRSLAMRRVFAVLERVADKDVSVLVRGETGTGKDLVARAIHDASPRRERPFVIVDCGSLVGEQIEAELFGSRAEGRAGALELAAGGTVFLDELTELPADVQAKLLRVLESGRYRQVGGSEERVADVRVIGASQPDLRACVADGSLREDLYFRLAVVGVELPALRDRREDIPSLIEAFSRRLPPGMWRPPGPEAMARLLGHEWPGNVRELRNVVERSAYLSPDGVIDLMATDRREQPSEPRKFAFDPTLAFGEQKERAIERFEEAYLRWLLERAGGNISRAAREADMDRKYLHKLLRRYGIDAKQYGK